MLPTRGLPLSFPPGTQGRGRVGQPSRAAGLSQSPLFSNAPLSPRTHLAAAKPDVDSALYSKPAHHASELVNETTIRGAEKSGSCVQPRCRVSGRDICREHL